MNWGGGQTDGKYHRHIDQILSTGDKNGPKSYILFHIFSIHGTYIELDIWWAMLLIAYQAPVTVHLTGI